MERSWASVGGAAAELVLAVRAGAGELAALALRQPLGVAVALALAGLVLVVLGSRWPRLVGALGGAAVGGLAVLAGRGALQARWPEAPVAALALAAAAGLLAAGGLWPRLAAVAAGALPGALLGAALPLGGDARPGGAVGALLLGLAAGLAWRKALAAIASLLGAILLGGAGLASLPGPLARELAERPSALLTWVAVLTAVGLAFQLGAAPAGGRARTLSPAGRSEAPAARSPGSRP